MHICMYACMHVCMHVCMYACMYVYLYSSIFVYLHVKNKDGDILRFLRDKEINKYKEIYFSEIFPIN